MSSRALPGPSASLAVLVAACALGVCAAAAPAAQAGDFVVRCQVDAAASGDGSGSQEHIFDSGEIESDSAGCGPTTSGAGGTIESTGPGPDGPITKRYTQSSNGTAFALASIGLLHGSASAAGLISGDRPNPYEASGTGTANASFRDRINIVGAPFLTMVKIRATVFLHSSASIDGAWACTALSADYARASIGIDLPDGSTTLDNQACGPPPQGGPQVHEFDWFAGLPFTLRGSLSLSARASVNEYQDSAAASISAENTGGVYLEVETPGASLSSASGHDYSPPASDSRAPTTDANISPAPNSAGWNGSDVSVTLHATDEDGGSGVRGITYSASGADPMDSTTEHSDTVTIPITSEGETTIAYRAEDNAGNRADEKTVTVLLDKSDPAVDCDSPDHQWHGADVRIGCRAHDEGGSGLVDPADAEFSLSTSVPSGTEDADSHTGGRRICDVADHCTAVAPVGGNMVDKRPPDVVIEAPAAGATMKLGDIVAARYNCNDGGSGVRACDGPVPNGASVDTGSVGHKTFAVEATDAVGNTASATSGYDVLYDFAGFFAPVDNPPMRNVATAGRSIPVKFSLHGNQGLGVLATQPTSQAIRCDTSAPVDPVEEQATSPAGLTYDPASDRYVYVWKTSSAWAKSCRRLSIPLADGTTRVATFDLR